MSSYLVGSFDGLRGPAPICKWIKPCDRSETDEELQSIWSCIPVKDLMTERVLLESPSGKTVSVILFISEIMFSYTNDLYIALF